MGTPYEEISENYSNRGAIKTDANLAQDALQLGGLDADDYAQKKYVRDYVKNNSDNINARTDELLEQLEEDLKGYTDTSIGNQDFTNFAKKTDVEAAVNNMKEHCAESCANSLNAAKEYTNNAINNVNNNINTINNNIDSINQDINELDGKYDELFQSVSNGKRQIAGAITDKGVYTSASDTFSKMAENIRRIETGGGEHDFSDATITTDTVYNGFIGYGKNGQRIVGTYEPEPYSSGGIDTSDATATSAQILGGYTAYARGTKVTGAYVPPEPIIIHDEVEEIYELNPADIPTRSTIMHFNTIHTNDIEVNDQYIIKPYNNGSGNKIGVYEPYPTSQDTYTEALKFDYTYSGLGIAHNLDSLKLSKVPSQYGYSNATKLLITASTYDRNLC